MPFLRAVPIKMTMDQLMKRTSEFLLRFHKEKKMKKKMKKRKKYEKSEKISLIIFSINQPLVSVSCLNPFSSPHIPPFPATKAFLNKENVSEYNVCMYTQLK
jgi:hypothetical protein